jgi:eukaryotic-like serine/threonine-protein kinase
VGLALESGARLGVYEIAALIGAGGMGEVYRARDTRLWRDVAIKILPDGVMGDNDRRSRFEREAQVLASLNHAGIATIHGVEEWGAGVALVMELVEGSTLAERIQAGPMAMAEARTIARQICEALEYAHERGIIHRDLKPANIKVRPDGAVKLLDFGLAKALEPDEAPGARTTNATHSPTLSLAGTRAGVILGTAAYMAPEQARGGPADRRADIWAFGCVLFEMLSGKQPFDGDTISDTLAAVLRMEPDWTRVPTDTPSHIRRLLKRCLDKDPRRRLQHIGDARLELDEAVEPASLATSTSPRPRMVWPIAAGIVVGAALVGAPWAFLPAKAPPSEVRRFRIALPTPTSIGAQSLVLSPDGRTIVTSIGVPPAPLYRRRLDSPTFEQIRGAELAAAPFFSPDSKWVAFFSEGKLKKVPIDGGLTFTICDAPLQVQGTWGDDDSIVVASGNTLLRVAASGGVLQPIVEVPDSEGPLAQPIFLPGSQAVLARAGLVVGAAVERGSGRRGITHIVAVDLRSLARHMVVEGSSPRLAFTGDLLFEQGGGMWAVGFDAKKLVAVGSPVRVIDSVRFNRIQALFSTARDGTLVFVSGGGDRASSMVWLDRTGKATQALEERAAFQSPRLSPDGKRVVVSIGAGAGIDLWVYEFERGTRLRLTTSGVNRRAIWYPDGTRIAFYSAPIAGGEQDLFALPASGGSATRLLSRTAAQFPDAISPQGRLLVFDEGGTTRDLWILPLDGGAPRPLVVTPFNERGAVLSPDGRWLAFVSDESGRAEVYVQPFPGPGAKVPISTAGGLQPVWARNGREVFFRQSEQLMAVAVASDPFRVGAAKRLFELEANVYNMDVNFADYDVAPDGRFLAVRNDRPTVDELEVVLNWTEELRRALKR